MESSPVGIFESLCKQYNLKGNPNDDSRLSRRYADLILFCSDFKQYELFIIDLINGIKSIENANGLKPKENQSIENLPKVLAFDHGGVLDGTYMDPTDVRSDDLILGDSYGYYQVLKNGVKIVELLNNLKAKGYLLAYHSSNVLSDQLKIHDALISECNKRGLQFPKIDYLVLTQTTNATPPPTIGKFLICESGKSMHGKDIIRTCIETELKQIDKIGSVIFDDGFPIIKKALEEGYSVAWICEENETKDGIVPTNIFDTLKRLSDQ